MAEQLREPMDERTAAAIAAAVRRHREPRGVPEGLAAAVAMLRALGDSDAWSRAARPAAMGPLGLLRRA